MAEKSVAVPILSATILVVRDGTDGLEVLMVKRHHEIDFASGAFVFPGGKACEDDSNSAWAAHFQGDAEGQARTAQISAIRELFEEAGILLARPSTGGDGGLVPTRLVQQLQHIRGAVDRGEQPFSDLAEKHGFSLAGDRLVHFGHWITPEMMPKRFDTHFYLAAAPAEQLATQDGRETTEAIWVKPADALAMEKAGEVTIIFPTRMNLGRLALADTVDSAMARFSGEPVTTVLPYLDANGSDGPEIVIPDIEGYGQTREPVGRVEKVMRKPG